MWLETAIGGVGTFTRFTSNPYFEPAITNGQIVVRQQQFTLESQRLSVLLEERARFRITQHLTLSAGGWFSGRLYSRLIRTDATLDGPSSGSRDTALGTDAESSLFGFGLLGAVGWQFNAAEGLGMELEIGPRVDAGNLRSGAGLRAVSFDFSVALWSFNAAPVLDDPLDTMRLDTVPLRDTASAQVRPPIRLPSAPRVTIVAEEVAGEKRRTASVHLQRIHRRLVVPRGGEQIIERMEAPALSITHAIDTALRSASSTLTLRLGNEMVGQWGGGGEIEDIPLRLDRDRLPTVLSAELKVGQHGGGELVARDTLLLRLDTVTVRESREDQWLIVRGGALPQSLEQALQNPEHEVSLAPFGRVDSAAHFSLVQRLTSAAGRKPKLRGDGEVLVRDLLLGRPPRGTIAVVTVRSQ